MRQLQEIENDIKEISNQICALNEKQNVLTAERNERMFADFCEEHGVKSGDVVELNDRKHTQVQVVDMNYRYKGWVRCHKLKKNGEPYSTLITFQSNEFDGCKVIKTIEE